MSECELEKYVKDLFKRVLDLMYSFWFCGQCTQNVHIQQVKQNNDK